MKHFLIAISAILCSLAVSAQSPMDQAIAVILDNNADIAAQHAMLRAQASDNTDANSLSNPQVAFGRVWGAHGIGNKLQLDISQGFDWPGLYRIRSLAAAQGISAQEMAIIASRLDLALQAKQLLIELVYVRKQIAMQNDLMANINKMAESLKTSLDRGEATILDYRKQQIEAFKLSSALAALLDRQSQIEAQLSGLASGASLNLAGIDAYPIEPTLSREEYLSQVAEVDPLLASQRLTTEQESLNAKAATQSRLPSFSVGFQHQAEMGDRFNGFTVGMSLPFFENRKARAAATARRSASESAANQITAQRQAEVESLLGQIDVWKKQIKAYTELFGTNDYMQLVAMAYEHGQITMLEYLSEAQYYIEAQQSCLEAEYNLASALCSLNRYSLL